jgi:hypothetical protein
MAANERSTIARHLIDGIWYPNVVPTPADRAIELAV